MAAEFPFSIDLRPPDRRARLVAAAYAAASWVRARRAAWRDQDDRSTSPAGAATPIPPAATAATTGASTTARGVWTGRER